MQSIPGKRCQVLSLTMVLETSSISKEEPRRLHRARSVRLVSLKQRLFSIRVSDRSFRRNISSTAEKIKMIFYVPVTFQMLNHKMKIFNLETKMLTDFVKES